MLFSLLRDVTGSSVCVALCKFPEVKLNLFSFEHLVACAWQFFNLILTPFEMLAFDGPCMSNMEYRVEDPGNRHGSLDSNDIFHDYTNDS